jgi:Tfp pilus assembly protein PilO
LKITAREKKYIWMGAIVVVAVLVAYGITLLLAGRQSLSEKVEFKKKLLQKQYDTLAHKAAYEAKLELYKKQYQADMNRLLPNESPNVAVAELQKVLIDFANSSGVEISQKNPLAEKKIDDKLICVRVQIQTNFTMDQLVQFLTSIENYDKFITIDDFMISGGGYMNPRALPGTPQRRNSSSLTISGYLNAPPKQGT